MFEVNEETLLIDMFEGIFEIGIRLDAHILLDQYAWPSQLEILKKGVRAAKAPTGTLSGNLFGDTSVSSGGGFGRFGWKSGVRVLGVYV